MKYVISFNFSSSSLDTIIAIIEQTQNLKSYIESSLLIYPYQGVMGSIGSHGSMQQTDFTLHSISKYEYWKGVIKIKVRQQCDQIGRFIGLWSNFSKPLATVILPKSPTFLGNFCKGVKNYHISREIILGNFYRHLAIFFWSHSTHSLALFLLVE